MEAGELNKALQYYKVCHLPIFGVFSLENIDTGVMTMVLEVFGMLIGFPLIMYIKTLMLLDLHNSL